MSPEKSYISMVKRIGIPWKIELAESQDIQSHLDYIESIKEDPVIEEAKILKFNKIAGFTILTETDDLFFEGTILPKYY
jgi:hypothetical protein